MNDADVDDDDDDSQIVGQIVVTRKKQTVRVINSLTLNTVEREGERSV